MCIYSYSKRVYLHHLVIKYAQFNQLVSDRECFYLRCLKNCITGASWINTRNHHVKGIHPRFCQECASGLPESIRISDVRGVRRP